MNKRKAIEWYWDLDGSPPYLRYREDGKTGPWAKGATAEDMADFLDRHAESENKHEFVGAHAALLDLFRDKIQQASTHYQLMRELVARGGLHGITGYVEERRPQGGNR